MRIIFLFLFLVSSLAISAQSDYDPRLLAKFSEERIVQLQREQPSVIDYWTYYLDHAYTIVNSDKTGKSFSSDETIEIKDLENFNILELDIHMDRKQSKTFKIKGTNSYLLLHSNQTFSELYSRNR